jgi:hypothetical protein
VVRAAWRGAAARPGSIRESFLALASANGIAEIVEAARTIWFTDS